MGDKRDSIIIPWDFTDASNFAFLHAAQLAKVVDNDIVLLHVVAAGGFFSKKADIEKTKEEAVNKLLMFSAQAQKEHNIKPQIIVRDGSFGKNLKDVVELNNSNLAIMGKYVLHGTNKISFKEVVKICETNNVPVVQTKAPPNHTHYTEIVVPVDHNKKYKEKLHWIIFLSKYYKFNVNIIKSHISDDLLKRQMSNNIFFTKKMLDTKNIVYGIKTAKKNISYNEEIYRFANDIEADLIVVMTPEYNQHFQHKIDHDVPTHIPIMCINPRADLQKFQKFG